MRRKLVIVCGLAALVLGAGAAIGATQLTPRDETKAVVEDAAEQLGVDPDKLSDALEQALENRVDEAVESGRLTEEQGERLKERIRAGEYPLFGTPGFRGHGPRGHGFRGRAFGGSLADLSSAADYLGLTEEAVQAALRGGKTLAQLARDRGKSVDGLVSALVAEKTERLDAAVEDGRLTRAQRDRIVATLKERVAARVRGERPAFDKRGFGGERKGSGGFGRSGFGFGGPGLAPGALPPAEGGSSRGGFDELPPAA